MQTHTEHHHKSFDLLSQKSTQGSIKDGGTPFRSVNTAYREHQSLSLVSAQSDEHAHRIKTPQVPNLPLRRRLSGPVPPQHTRMFCLYCASSYLVTYPGVHVCLPSWKSAACLILTRAKQRQKRLFLIFTVTERKWLLISAFIRPRLAVLTVKAADAAFQGSSTLSGG